MLVGGGACFHSTRTRCASNDLIQKGHRDSLTYALLGNSIENDF